MDGIDLSSLKYTAEERLAVEKQHAAGITSQHDDAPHYVAKEQSSSANVAESSFLSTSSTSLPTIIDATRENFRDIVEYSRYVPVIVDLWAEWCQPCKQLRPLLEKLAEEYQGRFLLAPINTEVEQELAAAFQVQSIPTVIALAAGKPFDMFTGAVPESQLRSWIDGALTTVDGGLAQAPASVVEHMQKLAGVTATTPPQNSVIDEAESLAQEGNYLAAQELLKKHLVNNPKDHAAESALAMYEMLDRASTTGEDAITKADENPGDVAAQCDAADLEMTTVGAEAAYTRLLNTVARTNGVDKDEARKHLVKLLSVAEATDPLVIAARAKLATLLY